MEEKKKNWQKKLEALREKEAETKAIAKRHRRRIIENRYRRKVRFTQGKYNEEAIKSMHDALAKKRETTAIDPNKNYTKEELEGMIDRKAYIFCHTYIENWNVKEAVAKAGYRAKDHNAVFHRLKNRPVVKMYLDCLLGDVEKAVGISKHRNLKELATMAYTNIADLHKDWFELEEFENLTREQKASIKSITKSTTSRGTTVKIELHDKKAALDSINKLLGYEKPQEVKVNNEISYGDDVLGDLRKVLGITKPAIPNSQEEES